MGKNRTSPPTSIGVIISTYNHPEWLRKTLWGYAHQTYKNFELIIADDGSDESTKELLEDFKKNYFPQLKHIWHPDEGFQKSAILNKALVAAESEYLIFTDQDCIPRYDFIETHLRYAEPGYFLSGGYFKLPMPLSQRICENDVHSKRAFNLKWLQSEGLKHNFKNTKLFRSLRFSKTMNCITPTNATWNGMNSSGWRTDMIKINGYNEEMHYGGQDREFGERLFNLGIKSKQIRYSAICLHLDHARPYKNKETIAKNRAIRKNTRKKKITQTPFGIEKLYGGLEQ